MVVCLNGEFLPEEQARVSVLDRGFLYGDGLFETLRVSRAVPFRWLDHVERLRQGAALLAIRLPWVNDELRALATKLIDVNQAHESVLRISISRGIGPRGYSPNGADSPTLAMTVHPAPALDPMRPIQWRLHTARFRVLADDPLARAKSANKLVQVLARAEADAHRADEALLLNTRGEITEGTASNVFWIESGRTCTIPLSCGALPGVTRKVVLEECEARRWSVAEKVISVETLARAEGVFLTTTTLGVVEAIALDGRELNRCSQVTELHCIYQRLVASSLQDQPSHPGQSPCASTRDSTDGP